MQVLAKYSYMRLQSALTGAYYSDSSFTLRDLLILFNFISQTYFLRFRGVESPFSLFFIFLIKLGTEHLTMENILGRNY